jgi:Mrp family chromosome partitioning ATPase
MANRAGDDSQDDMSKRTQRFGGNRQGPPGPGTPGEGSRSVPLPLVTQPMAAVSVDDAAAALARAGVAPEIVRSREPSRPPGASSGPPRGDEFSRPTVMDGSLAAAAAAASRNVGAQRFEPGARNELVRHESASTAIAVGGPAASRQAPEIGLTQHHLPDDVPADPRLVLVNEPDSDRAAAFRVLRHHLLEADRPQVIVVSSARPEEGKTTTAVNVALALAECGRAKVLLVETHVRRPQLAEVFQFTPPWCFAEQLAAHRHQPMLPWGLVDIPQVWLHVAAINPRIEQSQLLDAPAFAIAMDRLRQGGYDHIVIDSPPVLGSADVNLIQDAADGVLLAIRGKVSTARDLRQAIDQLSPAKILGTVLIEH